MMDRGPRTTEWGISDLVAGIETGTIALADFQRDFDWSASAVRGLLATVLMGWPAGSILAVDGEGSAPVDGEGSAPVDGEGSALVPRPFEGGPPPKTPTRLIILDGQQRLTALLQTLGTEHAAWATQEEVTVSLSALERGTVDDIEEGLRFGKRPGVHGEQGDLGSIVIPLRAATSPSEFFAWRDAIVLFLPDGLKREAESRLSQVYRDHLHWLHDQRFPVVVLDRTVSSEAVARIFERVNRSGLRLGSFDLVVARAYSHDWNLRDRWEEARYRFPRLEAFFGDDGLVALQVIALRESGDVRQAAVLNLPKDIVLDQWDEAVAAVHDAVVFLAEECGVRRPEWLPYPALMLFSAALAREGLLRRYPNEARRFVLSRAFALRYDAAANTRLVEDVRAFTEDPDLSVPATSRGLLLSSAKQKQAAIYRAFLCFVVSRGATDLLGNVLALGPNEEDDELYVSQQAVVTSLLPAGIEGRLHLRALSFVIAHPETALEIRRRRSDRNFSLFEAEALKSQLLPTGLEALADPRALLEARVDLLAEALKSDLGQSTTD